MTLSLQNDAKLFYGLDRYDYSLHPQQTLIAPGEPKVRKSTICCNATIRSEWIFYHQCILCQKWVCQLCQSKPRMVLFKLTDDERIILPSKLFCDDCLLVPLDPYVIREYFMRMMAYAQLHENGIDQERPFKNQLFPLVEIARKADLLKIQLEEVDLRVFHLKEERNGYQINIYFKI